mmetsp:Transcript_29771/g.64469  ORF Transcript_29771/g.64469 Transcript_29771/m.64469 type:complete len:82 (-) Transcript_29771:439-684(-)
MAQNAANRGNDGLVTSMPFSLGVLTAGASSATAISVPMSTIGSTTAVSLQRQARNRQIIMATQLTNMPRGRLLFACDLAIP